MKKTQLYNTFETLLNEPLKLLFFYFLSHFHCDEALAIFMLKQLPKYKDSQLVRYYFEWKKNGFFLNPTFYN